MKTKQVVLLGTAALGLLLIVIAAILFIRPYDVPEFIEVDSSESAFLIPLEGDTTNQAAFHSVEFLKEKKVAAKRVQITHRWNQTGFLPQTGHWIGTVRLIKVDRRPVTREWTKSPKSGTTFKDEAVSAESRDSVGFSIGVGCTAFIPEEMAAVFLYSYPSKSLADMLDTEVRNRVHQIIAEKAGEYDLFELPAKKNEIMKAVREDVLPFFKKKGIEITTLAMLGGLTFENPEVQKAIDDAAKAAQLKVAAEAKRAAQEVENKTLLLAAEGKAAAAKRDAESQVEVERVKAEGEAKTRLLAAEADANALRKMADAKAYEAQKVSEAPAVYMRLRLIDMEAQRLKQWDGRFPSYLVQTGNGTGNGTPAIMLPPMPALDRAKVSAPAENK
ncbi:MAG: hypothetical protein HY040_03245 [Planctomycetes bacterium]|nr:hypothetical protein [Planctomycetota bacterium]